jgi:hypothetical protein
VSTRTLAEGRYYFKTLTDANLRVVHGGVEAQAVASSKDNDPTPPLAAPNAKGDEPEGELPTLTIESRNP